MIGSEAVFPAARRVEQLAIDGLPLGATTRLEVDVVHDGLGRPISLPVLVMRGRRPGPVVGLTAAVHGDELNGISVLHRLFDRMDPAALRGTLVGVMVINVPGYLRNMRTLNQSMDINHLFPGRLDGNEAEIYAARVVERLIRPLEYLFDMHTASRGRVNSLYVRADLGNPEAAQMARLQRPQIILADPPTDGTLRGCADALGIPAITLEIGDPQRFQAAVVRRTLIGIRAVLSSLGMLPRRKAPELSEPVVCDRSHWLYTDHGGLLEVFPEVAEHVEADAPIARLSNIYGDVIREYRAPWAGVVIGKSVNPVAPSGARILHLGHVAEAG